MQALHIRDVPPDVVAALKRRAQANHRSMQGELLTILEEAAGRAPRAEALPPLRLVLSGASTTSTWSREEIYGDDGR